MKYFVLGAIASGMLLYGMSLIYGVTGTLDIPTLSQTILESKADSAKNVVLILGLVMLITGIAFKLGAVPFHMWIPDIYHGAPTAVTLYLGTAPKIAAFAKEIGPDRIHLNTAVRPPAEDFAAALTRERMEELIHLFHPTAEIITEFSAKHAGHMQVSQEEIFSMLKRRPCTANQIGKIFGMHFNEVSKYLGNLIRNNQIRTECKNTSVYYAAINSKDKCNAHV